MTGWAAPFVDPRTEQVETGQLPLFGTDLQLPVPTDFVSRAMALDGNGQRVRKSDPITSHLAASSITAEGLHASQSWVLAELRTLGIATMPQLIRRVPMNERSDLPRWSDSRIRSAVKELSELGFVTHLDDEGITQRGRSCARYQAVKK